MRTFHRYSLYLISALGAGLSLLMFFASFRWFVIEIQLPGISQELHWALLLGASLSWIASGIVFWLARHAIGRKLATLHPFDSLST
jgi:hypothetical protein